MIYFKMALNKNMLRHKSCLENYQPLIKIPIVTQKIDDFHRKVT